MSPQFSSVFISDKIIGSMATSFLVASSLAFAPSPLPALGLRAPLARAVVGPLMMVDPLLDPSIFDSASGAIDSAFDFGTFGRAGICGLVVYSALTLLDPPSKAYEEKVAKRADAAVAGFGWLQADMSVPLPSFAELADSCHRIGVKEGATFYLCGQPSENFSCALSDDFSEYYGERVYVCRQVSPSPSIA